MSRFKKIYFPIISGLMILFIILSFVDVRGGFVSTSADLASVKEQVRALTEAPRFSQAARNNSVDYIESELRKLGLIEANTTDGTDGKQQASYAMLGGTRRDTYTVQAATLTAQERKDYYEALGIRGELYADTNLQNVIAALPANDSNTEAQTFIFMVNYDSTASTVGASGALGVASMLQAISQLKSNTTTRTNDLVFVFADKGIENDVGFYAFLNKFIGFNNAVSKAQLCVSMSASGNRGTVVLSQLNIENNKILSVINKSGVYTSSVAQTFGNNFSSLTDYAKLSGGFPSLNLTATAGRENMNTANDTLSNLSEAFIRQHTAVAHNLAKYLSQNKVDISTTEGNLVYFRYLGISIAYPVVAAMILVGLIVGLIAAIVYFNIRLKAFGWKNAGWGAIASLCSFAASIATMFAVYCLFALVYAGYSMYNIRYFFALSFSSVGLAVASMSVALTASLIWCMFFKWVFGVRAADMSLGNSAIAAVAAMATGWAVPKLAFALVAFSTMQLTVLLINIILKKRFKEKFGFDINRLFLNFIPLLLSLPLVIPTLLIAGDALGAVFYPLIFALFLIVVQSLMPYFAILERPLGALFAKLPHTTRRVVRYVDKEVPNPARKGTTKTITEKQIVREKMPIHYHHAFSSILLGLLSVILVLSFSIGGNIHTNYAANCPIDPFYENAVVYHLDRDEGKGYWEVHDLGIARYISSVFDDYSWDSQKQAYVKADITTDNSRHIEFPRFEQNSSSRTAKFTPMDPYSSRVILDFEFIGTMPTSIKVINGDGSTILTYNLTSVDRNLKLTLPIGVGIFTLEFSSAVNCTINYTEQNRVRSTLSTYSEWKAISTKYDATTTIGALNPHYLITRTISLSV